MTGQRLVFHAWALGLAAVLWCVPLRAAAEAPLQAEAERVLAAPPERVRAALLDLEGFGRWFPTVVEWRILSRGEREARVYGRQDFPWPAGDRDYVARYRWWSEGDAFRLEAVGESASAPPVPEGVIRIERFRSEWRLAPDPSGGTRTRYLAEGPVEGRLARWLAGIAWQHETRRVLDGLERELRERAETGPDS